MRESVLNVDLLPSYLLLMNILDCLLGAIRAILKITLAFITNEGKRLLLAVALAVLKENALDITIATKHLFKIGLIPICREILYIDVIEGLSILIRLRLDHVLDDINFIVLSNI